jgi:hypothetical protein
LVIDQVLNTVKTIPLLRRWYNKTGMGVSIKHFS